MIRLISLCSIAVCLVAGMGCQSTMPWEKNTMPPVELLDEEQTSDEVVTPSPPQQSGLLMAPDQRFKDIPLPAKAKEDKEGTDHVR